MIIDARKIDSKLNINCDICILGGGVAGIVLANELKKTDKKIVILESGGENIDPEIQNLYSSAVRNKNYPDTTYSRLRMLGGSSNHWENNTTPLDRIDFEKKDWVENSGWPISYSDLEKHYIKAAQYCGTKSDGYDVDYWSNKLNYDVQGKDAVRNILKTAIAKASTPPVRFYETHGNKVNNEKNIDIYKYSNVVDLNYGINNEIIEKVYFEANVGIRHSVNAKIFIMCLGGIENARMLLNFNISNENKIGNYYDNVGRYFMDHPVVRAGQFYPEDKNIFSLYNGNSFDDRIIRGFFKLSESAIRKHEINNIRVPLRSSTNFILSDGVSSYHILNDSLSKNEIPDNFGTHISNIIKDFDMVIEGVSRKKFDTKFIDDADEFVGYQLPIMMEQSPDRNNRIKLANKKDKYGINKILVDWELKDYDKDNLWRSLEIVAQEFGAQSLGRVLLLKERESRIWSSQLGFGHHHMGTTRMSSKYENGVVDKNHLVYGTKNLYVGGSSVFPTGGHVPPTLTIVAMSIRLAKIISKEKLS